MNRTKQCLEFYSKVVLVVVLLLLLLLTGPASNFLTDRERTSNIVAIHEKNMTCPPPFCCCHLPYLRTLDHQHRYLGETRYVCDECIFVPKFTVLDKHRTPKYLLRPDTCFHGLCVRCRFGGARGKCARLPFLIRDPTTGILIHAKQTADGEDHAQVTQLWSGLANEVCFKRHAYHVAFPEQQQQQQNKQHQQQSIQCSVEDKLVLIGVAVFIDVVLFEKNDDN